MNAVRIYGENGAFFSSMSAYVSLEDYTLLQAALREALDGWRDKKTLTNEQFQRIAELRAQFLDDK